MKKRRSLFITLVAILMCCSLLCMSACWDDFFPNSNGNSNSNSKTVELTMDNYQYYLSIDSICTSSVNTTVIGTVSTIKVTISGAVSGLYENCIIYYTLGDTEHEVKLNAAGFATFNYTISNNSGEFKFSGATGQITLN